MGCTGSIHQIQLGRRARLKKFFLKLNGIEFRVQPWVDPWFEDDKLHEMWLKVAGIPHIYWNEQNFKDLVEEFGILYEVHQDTLDLSDMSKALLRVGVVDKSKIPDAKYVKLQLENGEWQGVLVHFSEDLKEQKAQDAGTSKHKKVPEINLEDSIEDSFDLQIDWFGDKINEGFDSENSDPWQMTDSQNHEVELHDTEETEDEEEMLKSMGMISRKKGNKGKDKMEIDDEEEDESESESFTFLKGKGNNRFPERDVFGDEDLFCHPEIRKKDKARWERGRRRKEH